MPEQRIFRHQHKRHRALNSATKAPRTSQNPRPTRLPISATYPSKIRDLLNPRQLHSHCFYRRLRYNSRPANLLTGRGRSLSGA
jgi:hypothetical protein